MHNINRTRNANRTALNKVKTRHNNETKRHKRSKRSESFQRNNDTTKIADFFIALVNFIDFIIKALRINTPQTSNTASTSSSTATSNEDNISNDVQNKISEESIANLSDEEIKQFINEGLTCPISFGIILNPVKLEFTDTNGNKQIQGPYNKESIEEWLNINKTDPKTNLGIQGNYKLVEDNETLDNIFKKINSLNLPPENPSFNTQDSNINEEQQKTDHVAQTQRPTDFNRTR